MKLLLIGLITIFTASSALACSCAQMVAQDLIDHSDMLFVGFPTADSVPTGQIDTDFGSQENKTPFTVTRAFTKIPSKNIDLFAHSGNGANCGVNFKAYSGVYLVSAYNHPGTDKFSVSSCSLGYVGNERTYKLILELERLSASN